MSRLNVSLLNRNLTIRLKIWLYFMIFVCVLFILMWTFQVLLLEPFYRSMRTDSMISATHLLGKFYQQDDFVEIMQKAAIRNDMCIEVLNENGAEQGYSCIFSGNCLLHNHESNDMYFFLMDLQNSPDGKICRTLYNRTMQSDMLVYGCTLHKKNGDFAGYLLTNGRLLPVSDATRILKRITMIITCIMIVIGCALSAYVARHIGTPINRLTSSAKRLAQGDYTTKFTGGGCAEVDALAEMLTYTEKELSRTDEMQRDLIANVSHDMRTPLTMMKAYAEMIRDLSGDNPVKREKHLGIIIEETDRLSLLVNDMLDLSKLESGTQGLDIHPIDISERVREIAMRYQEISEQMGYHLYFTGDAPCTVQCDAGKIERVICNLLNNAINYTSKEDRKVYLRQINQPNCVRIEITDTGDGIEEEKIKLIFDKYYRSENHKREVVGTGLGLSIVKAILKLHSYNYGVNSKLGEGSTFWFEITR